MVEKPSGAISSTKMKCVACKRQLPTHAFGYDRANQKTGYCPTCKACRNYRRKKTYRLSAPPDALIHKVPLTILPLREHLEAIIPKVVEKSGFNHIRATYVPDSIPKFLVIDTNDPLSTKLSVYPRNDVELDLKSVAPERVFQFAGGTLEERVCLIIEMLYSLEIRPHLGEKIDV